MYSWTQRLNSVTTFGATILGILALLLTISGYFQRRESSVVKQEIDVNEVLALTRFKNTKNDQALMSFDINIDTTDLFHWNTKQVFVFLTASYNVDDDRKSSIVIWDKTFRFNTEKNFEGTDIFMKYPLIDKGDELRNQTVTFSLSWDVTPFVGLMYTQTHPKTFTKILPEKYTPINNLQNKQLFLYEGEY